MIPIAESLREHMLSAGLDPGTLPIPDGATHRFHVDGDKRGSQNGWYRFYGDHPANASFGTYKQPGIVHRWKTGSGITSAIGSFPKATRGTPAANYAAIWEAAPPARETHPYLQTKQIPSLGLRFHKGALLIPVMDTEGRMHGLQRIWPDGAKRFFPGSVKTGHCYLIGPSVAMETIYIAEGYATCATIHAATGQAVAVAFDAGNLQPVAHALRAAFPCSRLILCADDDFSTDGNPGLTNAMNAAEAVKGALAVPNFASAREKKDTDFNDLARKEGLEVVRLQLEHQGEVLCSE